MKRNALGLIVSLLCAVTFFSSAVAFGETESSAIVAPVAANSVKEQPAVVTPVAADPVKDFKLWGGMIRPGIESGPGDENSIHTDFQFELFLPVWQNRDSLVFIDPRIRLADNDSHEFNFGLGFRKLVNNESVILGANAYYDYLRSINHFDYDQLGLGFEALSKWVDWRANLYFPFGNRMHLLSVDTSHTDFDYYTYEEVLQGGDMELGVMVPYISDFMETRLFFGGFWYNSYLLDTVDGWKGRIEVRPVKMINLNYEIRRDSTRKTDNFYGAYLDIPFSLEALVHGNNPFEDMKDATTFGKGARSLRERMTEKVVRDRHITTVTGVEKKDKPVVCSYNDKNYKLGDQVHPPCTSGLLDQTSTWTCVKGEGGGVWSVNDSQCIDHCIGVTCTAQDQCHDAGTCIDHATGACSNPVKANGSACDDGNANTAGEVCTNGTCSGGIDHCTGVTCTAQDQCHVAGTCIDHATGACSNPTKPNGTACDDGDANTTNDVCTAGVCAGTGTGLCTGVICTAQDQCHVAGTCNPTNGVCSNPTKPNGTACDDGNANTVGEVCTNGTCSGGVDHCIGVTCTAQDQCHDAGTCIDHATGTCSNPTKPNGTACDDGNANTTNDVCTNGTCGGTDLCAGVTCTAQDQCHVAGTCNPSTGACSNPAKANGSACDDGLFCTGTDTCSNGTCSVHSGDPCTGGTTCNEATDHCDAPACGGCVTHVQGGTLKGYVCDPNQNLKLTNCTSIGSHTCACQAQIDANDCTVGCP